MNRILIRHINKIIDNEISLYKDKKLLEKYGVYDILYSDDINEGLLYDEEEDGITYLGFLVQCVKPAIPKMIKTLVKNGLGKSVKLCAQSARFIKEHKKSSKEAVLSLFYSLLLLTVGLGGNSFIEKYNKKPIIPETSIAYKDNKLAVKNGDYGLTIIEQLDKNEAPIIHYVKNLNSPQVNAWTKKMYAENREITIKPPHNVNISVYQLPMHQIQPGEQKIEITEPSEEMVNAIAHVESFQDHLYDSDNSSRKLTINDLKNPGRDITIGYGHAVKSFKERMYWYGKTISEEEALKLFKEDLKTHTETALRNIRRLPYYNKVNISQGMFDVILSLTFNAGCGNIFGGGGNTISTFWQRMISISFQDEEIFKKNLYYALSAIKTQNTGNSNQKGLLFRRDMEYKISMQPYGTIKPELYVLLK